MRREPREKNGVVNWVLYMGSKGTLHSPGRSNAVSTVTESLAHSQESILLVGEERHFTWRVALRNEWADCASSTNTGACTKLQGSGKVISYF